MTGGIDNLSFRGFGAAKKPVGRGSSMESGSACAGFLVCSAGFLQPFPVGEHKYLFVFSQVMFHTALSTRVWFHSFSLHCATVFKIKRDTK